MFHPTDELPVLPEAQYRGEHSIAVTALEVVLEIVRLVDHHKIKGR